MERHAGYEEWLDTYMVITEEDVNAMAAEAKVEAEWSRAKATGQYRLIHFLTSLRANDQSVDFLPSGAWKEWGGTYTPYTTLIDDKGVMIPNHILATGVKTLKEAKKIVEKYLLGRAQ